MKTIMKQLLLVAALMTVAVSAHAAGVNKGSKSYQKADKAETVAKTETPDNLADIAPAAGATQDVAEEAGKKEKNMREEIRLPRKN